MFLFQVLAKPTPTEKIYIGFSTKHAEEILEQGKADIIGLCRALLADPDWPVKAKEGGDKEIVRCVACNWCLEADSRYEQVKCDRYPEGTLHAPEPFLPKMARAPKFEE